MFGWMTNTKKLVKILTNFFAYHQRRQNPRWPPIMVKKIVLGIRQAAINPNLEF